MPRAGNEYALDMPWLGLRVCTWHALSIKWTFSLHVLIGKRVCTWHALNIKWTCQGQDHL